VRVEEELKTKRQLMQRGFHEMGRRFRSQTSLIGVGFVLITTHDEPVRVSRVRRA
jgi:hypothetical protein